MRILDYFDRVAIINLAERSDRREETVQEFRRIGWTIENDKIKFFNAIRPMEADGFPSVGVRGCYLSHYNVVKQAKCDNLSNILIMEDDIAFIKNIDKCAYDLATGLEKTRWGILYLGHEYQPEIPSGNLLEKLYTPLPLAHFYAINSRIYDRFLDFLEQLLQRKPGDPMGGPMHYDGAISTFRMQNQDIETYVVMPSLGYQRSSCTDLHKLSYLDEWPILVPVTRQFRRFKNTFKRMSM